MTRPVPALVRGAVGDGAGAEFLSWLIEMDLPDPEEVLADPACLPAAGARGPGLRGAGRDHRGGHRAAHRGAVDGRWRVLGIAASAAPDVAAAAARVLARHRPDWRPAAAGNPPVRAGAAGRRPAGDHERRADAGTGRGAAVGRRPVPVPGQRSLRHAGDRRRRVAAAWRWTSSGGCTPTRTSWPAGHPPSWAACSSTTSATCCARTRTGPAPWVSGPKTAPRGRAPPTRRSTTTWCRPASNCPAIRCCPTTSVPSRAAWPSSTSGPPRTAPGTRQRLRQRSRRRPAAGRRGPPGPGADPGGGLPRPAGGPGLPGWQADLLRRLVATECLRHGQEAGTVPAGLLRWAQETLTPVVNWRRLLAAELRRAVADRAGAADYSYRRPSRRAAVTGDVVLPALRRPVPEVAVVCDTSGSMTDELLAMVLAEVEGLLRSLGADPAAARAGLRRRRRCPAQRVSFGPAGRADRWRRHRHGGGHRGGGRAAAPARDHRRPHRRLHALARPAAQGDARRGRPARRRSAGRAAVGAHRKGATGTSAGPGSPRRRSGRDFGFFVSPHSLGGRAR